MELSSIVNFGDTYDVAPLLLSVDNPLALANNKHIRQFALIVIGPSLPYFCTRVEESGLTSTEGADAGGEGSSHHGELWYFLWLADFLVWYLRIPIVGMVGLSGTFFFGDSSQPQRAPSSMR